MAEYDRAAERQARERQGLLAKPPGSLGLVEELGARLAGMAGRCPPPRPDPAFLTVFAADHGVHAQGVTPWPQAISAAVASAIATGGGAAAVLARSVGATLEVVDVGLVHDAPGTLDRKVRRGSRDLSVQPAMSEAERHAAHEVGVDRAAAAIAAGARVLLTGEVGLGNTTAAAAVIAATTGAAAVDVTGRGSGIDDETLRRKVAVVERALARRTGPPILEVGGLELAALAGYIETGAAAGLPVVLDGVITLAAAVTVPHTRDFLVASHRPAEPGGAVALEHLGLTPLLDLGLRLGEGTGALLALPLLRAAADVLTDMATLDDLS